MTQEQHNQLVSFIWNIANDVLVNKYNKGDYRKVILPFIVLRRLDADLEPTKDAVIKMKELLDLAKIGIASGRERVGQTVTIWLCVMLVTTSYYFV